MYVGLALIIVLGIIRLVITLIWYICLLIRDTKDGKFTSINKQLELQKFKEIFRQRPDLCSNEIENYIKCHLHIAANGIRSFNPNVETVVKIGRELRQESKRLNSRRTKITKNEYYACYIEVYLESSIRSELLAVRDRNVAKVMMTNYIERALNHIRSVHFEDNFPLYLAEDERPILTQAIETTPSAPSAPTLIPVATAIEIKTNEYTVDSKGINEMAFDKENKS